MAYRQEFYGTIRASSTFNPDQCAADLHKAMKGFGCNKDTVIRIITGINNAQRQMIRTPFKSMYGKDLVSELKSELSGDFEDVILALMETPIKYDAVQLHSAMKGFGTKEKILIEIICSRTNEELGAVCNEYKDEFHESLESAVKGDTSGDMEHLLVALLQGNRDNSMHVDNLKANQDAHKLLKDGEKKIGTVESTFFSILVTQNLRQLDRVFMEYEKISGHTLETAIKKEFSGDVQKALLTLIQCIQNKPRYFVNELNEAMKGLGTHDKDLIRILVSRSEIDLFLIRGEFERTFGKSLVSAIKSECSGAYKDALIHIVNGNL